MDINIGNDSRPAIEQKIQIPNPDEQMVRTRLLLSFPDGKFNVKKIKENVFSIGNKDTWWFEDKAGKVLINLAALRWDDEKTNSAIQKDWKDAFRKFSFQAGYQEIDDSKLSNYTLYNIRGKERQVVPRDTEEYFRAWQEIDFFYDRLREVFYVEWAPKNEQERKTIIKNLTSAAAKGYVRIHDLIVLSSSKLGYLKRDDFNNILPLARNALLEQIGDPKWQRTLDPVTKRAPYIITQVELDQYRQLNLIDANLYAQATKKLVDVERAKQAKESQAKSKVDETKARIDAIRK